MYIIIKIDDLFRINSFSTNHNGHKNIIINYFYLNRILVKYIESLNSINDYVYIDDENCLTLLHLATGLDCEYREEVIEFLIEHRADLNRCGRSDGISDIRPLHLASMWGYDLTVKLLLFHGADASLRDSKGLSPVDYASIFDNYLCISLLLRYGSLNSTASAWSAIMDSSLGESTADTSFENYLYTTALELAGGDESKLEQSILCDNNNVFGSIDDDDYDPLDHVKDEEIDLRMDRNKLRCELKRLGRNPGPITETTKKVYAKLLAYLAKEDKELVYSPRTTNKSKLNGYSIQLNSILTGSFSSKQALELEKEFIRLSGSKDYHGPKQFFNYILIDPRISKNLPEQAMEASDSDTSGNQLLSPTNNNGQKTINNNNNNPKCVMAKVNRKFNHKLFTTFIESIFYVGKGQKKRDLMHLYDALADRDSITHKKIDRIRSIWDDGYGVVSLHLFHNITSKEALTREALMIETIGLQNLTNILKGTIQFKLKWTEHKRKVLGALLLHRAYNQLLNEGERQLKRDDLKR